MSQYSSHCPNNLPMLITSPSPIISMPHPSKLATPITIDTVPTLRNSPHFQVSTVAAYAAFLQVLLPGKAVIWLLAIERALKIELTLATIMVRLHSSDTREFAMEEKVDNRQAGRHGCDSTSNPHRYTRNCSILALFQTVSLPAQQTCQFSKAASPQRTTETAHSPTHHPPTTRATPGHKNGQLWLCG